MWIVALAEMYVEERIDAHYFAAIIVEWANTEPGCGSLTYIHN
jgi:hypothetical protein